MSTSSSTIRARWAAIGAAVAVALGAGGFGIVHAVQSDGARGAYTSIEPCRLVDTRPDHGIGGRTTPLGPDETYAIQATGDNGHCIGIPGDAIAVALNVTPVGATDATNVRFWHDGPVPNVSSLNPAPGQRPIPNAVTVDLADGGSFNVYNFQGRVHLVADIVGVYRAHDHDDRYYTEDEVDGAVAQAGFRPWEKIPSGVTVTGSFSLRGTVSATYHAVIETIDLPGLARAPLTDDDVEFDINNVLTGDADPGCNGTWSDPTAPLGLVCIYFNDHGGVASANGIAGPLPDRSFAISVNPSTISPDQLTHMTGTWAYHAPRG